MCPEADGQSTPMAERIDWFALTDEEMLDAAEKLIMEEPNSAEVSRLVKAVVDADKNETDNGDDDGGPGKEQ